MNPNELDPQALNLAKAIRRAETGTSTDPYNTRGASGEYGAYQFMPDTWKQWAGQYLQNPNAEYTVENQNRVAYSRIKELKDQGLTPAQIASIWNSGDKDAYKGTFSSGKPSSSKAQGGKPNSQGVDYDVPGYVQKVSAHYNELKNGQNQINPMMGVPTMENRPVEAPVEPPTEPLPAAEPEQGKDFGSRLGAGILDFVAPILTKKDRTAGEWVGDAALTALNVVPGAALLKTGLRGAKAGIGALRGAEALSKTEKAAEVASGVVKSRLSPKNIAIGTGTGYGLDVASSLSEGETDVKDVLTPGVGTALGVAGGALARTAPRAEVEKAARDLIPDLSYGKSVKAAGRTGLVKEGGIMGRVSQPVTADVYKTTEAVLKNVPEYNRLGTYTEKLNAVNSARTKLADDLERQIEINGDNIIYPYRELEKKMSSLELPIQVRADATQLRQFEIAQQAAMEIARKNGGDIKGLFRARKEFDDLVEKEFPTLYDRENAPMREAITSMRRVMNETIEDSLKGKVEYADSLKQQTQLFNARDALASKAYSEVGTNRLQRWGAAHPYTTGAIKAVLPVGAAAGATGWLLKD